jgi:hypothetical protein
MGHRPPASFERTATRSSNDPQICWRRRRPDYHTISPNFQTILTFSQRDGDAMNCRALLLSSFLIALATVSSAHEPKGHIDLDVVSKTHLFQRSSLCAFRAEAVKHRGFPGGNLTLIRSSPTDRQAQSPPLGISRNDRGVTVSPKHVSC